MKQKRVLLVIILLTVAMLIIVSVTFILNMRSKRVDDKMIFDCEHENYTVQTGDTLESISSKYKSSEENIIDSNGLSNNIVYPGMQLVIPLCSSIPTP